MHANSTSTNRVYRKTTDNRQTARTRTGQDRSEKRREEKRREKERDGIAIPHSHCNGNAHTGQMSPCEAHGPGLHEALDPRPVDTILVQQLVQSAPFVQQAKPRPAVIPVGTGCPLGAANRVTTLATPVRIRPHYRQPQSEQCLPTAAAATGLCILPVRPRRRCKWCRWSCRGPQHTHSVCGRLGSDREQQGCAARGAEARPKSGTTGAC